MKIKSLSCIAMLSLIACAGQAEMIANHIIGVGPNNSVTPYFCIQNASAQVTCKLAVGDQPVDGNACSGNPGYFGGALRFGGCDASNTYLGYLGVSGKNISYSPPQGVHVAFTNGSVDADGNLTGAIQYTPITPNFNLLKTAPIQNNTWSFVGFNLSGLEFSKMIDPVVIPNLSQEDAAGNYSDLADTQKFIQASMNTVRVPVRWGYLQLQGPGQGDINLNYYNSYVKPLLETLTSAKVHAIVDLHSYMHYSVFGKQYAGCGMDGACPDGTLILDANAYQDIWTKLFALIKADPKIDINYIMLDLVNEPVGVPDDLVFTIQAQVIRSLRQQGFNGYILVEGNNWSGMHSWTTTSWTSSDGAKTYTNAILFTRENFAQAGVADLSHILINVHQYLDSNYSGTQNQCQTDLSTTGEKGFNLNAFVNYLQQNQLQAIVTEFGAGTDSATCTVALNKFLQYLKENSAEGKNYGFVGWTVWATGHGWGNYNLRVTPDSYQMNVLQAFLN